MGLNQTILQGNITRDIQLKFLPNQTAVAEFGIAVNRKFKDKEEVCFVDVTVFGKQAEVINKHFQKGEPILIVGRLKFDSWKAQDGSKRSKLSVIMEKFEFIGSQKQSNDSTRGGFTHDQRPKLDEAGNKLNEDIPF